MSAETLRKAAALMRERAEAATPGPWISRQEHGRDFTDEGWSYIAVTSVSAVDYPDVAATAYPGDSESGLAIEDAEHIASWHPAVAVHAADWLDLVAVATDAYPTCLADCEDTGCQNNRAALTFARTYLGEVSP